MNKLIIFIGFFIYIALCDDVRVLTDENFKSIYEEEIILVEFYAPWCGHCKQLEPEYAKAATILLKSKIPLAKIDATEHEKSARKYDVQGFPSLKIFRKGEVSDYSGPRDSDGIVKYMVEQAEPAAKVLKTLDQLNELKEDRTDVFYVGYFEKPSDKSDLYKLFVEVAEEFRGKLPFYLITNTDIIKSESDSKDQIIGYPPFSFPPRVFGGSSSYVSSAESWAKDTAIYPVVLFNEHTYRRLKGYGEPIVKLLKKVAEKHGNFGYALCSSSIPELREEVTDYQKLDAPFVITLENNQGVFLYKGPDKFTIENTIKFLDDWEANKLSLFVKSEPIPDPNDNKGPVIQVVGDNFHEIINDKSKDVLVEIYAPWCGHCKELTPKYEKLAKMFDDDDSIVIAKIDATANTIPTTFIFDSFPSLFYAPAGGAKYSVIKYVGNREVPDMEQWLKKQIVANDKKRKQRDEL